jgi:hypothetical protein
MPNVVSHWETAASNAALCTAERSIGGVGDMEGRRLRDFAFQCFIAALDSREPIVGDDYWALGARLMRRANEKDKLIPSGAAPEVSPLEVDAVPRSK